MDILVNYRDFPRTDALDANIRRQVSKVLDRFSNRLTRVEVHIGDENGPKGGKDMRCLIEARPAGEQPVSAESQSTDAYKAARSAVAKLRRVLSRRFDRR